MSDETRGMLSFEASEGPLQAYLARPDRPGPRPAVIVIHEIWGLSDHIKYVADRFAGQGYVAFAPNLFSRPDLSEVMIPANIADTFQFTNSIQRERIGDPAYIQQELARLPVEKRERVERTFPMIMGGIPKDRLTQDLVKAVDYLKSQPFVDGTIASVGFCFGGGMSINLACHTPLAASVVFYGENPNPIDLVQNIAGPVMGLYGAEDMRINSRLNELVAAMVQYRKEFEMKIYPGAGHAFFNETNKNGYREVQAQDAWERVLRFYQKSGIG